jgi:hypothetical protein
MGSKLAEKIRTADLYQKCNLCDGTLVTAAPILVDGYVCRPGARPYSGRLAKGSRCPCVDSPSPGFMQVGMSLEDFDAVRKNYGRALLLLESAYLGLKRLRLDSPTAVRDLSPVFDFLDRRKPQLEAARREADKADPVRDPIPKGE